MDSVVIHGSLDQREIFLFSNQERTDTHTRISEDIHTVPKPIRHNPDLSLPLIISGHGFCGHPWLSRSEGDFFSLAARKGLMLILGFWKLYILYPSQ